MQRITVPEKYCLSRQQEIEFEQNGYVILPSFLPSKLTSQLKNEVDYWIKEGLREISIKQCNNKQPPAIIELDLKQHGALISYPPLMSILEQILGGSFAFHHMHSDRNDQLCSAKNWHHDYEQYPQSNRRHKMVHVFHYLNGLDGKVADLVLLPETQRIVLEKKALDFFKTKSLPGEIVIDNVPEGTTIIIHSGILHARRVKSSIDKEWKRYLIDCSYCQGGTKWPHVKGYWKEMLTRAKELGLDRDRPELFDPKYFYDPDQPQLKLETVNQGVL